LTDLTKSVLETALEAAMDDHLGYAKHSAAGRDGGNSRNGTRSKTVLTEIGEVPIDVPRDRDGTFEPKIVRKRQRRLSGVDELVISLAAKGLTTGEVQAHRTEVYGAEVSLGDGQQDHRCGHGGVHGGGSRVRSIVSIRSCSSMRSWSRSVTARS